MIVGMPRSACFFQHDTLVCRRDGDNLRLEVNVFLADFTRHCVNVFLPERVVQFTTGILRDLGGDSRPALHSEPLGLALDLKKVVVVEKPDQGRRREIECGLIGRRGPDGRCHRLPLELLPVLMSERLTDQ